MTFDFGTYLSAEGGEVKGRDTRGQGSQKPVKRELEPADREDLMEKVADLGNLVRAWKRVKANKGAGPLSPLLANIVLDELDKELERRGHRFCRYADDCNIYVIAESPQAHEAMNTRGFAEQGLIALALPR